MVGTLRATSCEQPNPSCRDEACLVSEATEQSRIYSVCSWVCSKLEARSGFYDIPAFHAR